MRNIPIILCITLVLLVVGCSNKSGISATTETQTKEIPTEQIAKEQEVKKTSGLITEKLSFKDEDISGTVIKNKLTKTAEAKIDMFIPDDIEKQELLGQEVSAVPMTVNLICGLFGTAFFDPSALQELTKSGNLTAESGENFLQGYSITKSAIKFIDKEDKKLIADCTATGSKWENIKFNAYREYENSLFGMVIGKTMEEVEMEAAKKSLSKEITHLEVKCLGPENWDADADEDGITLGIAPLSADNTIVAAEGSIITKSYVLEKNKDTWEYYKGELVNTRDIPDIEGDERLNYFSNWDGYLIRLIWDNTESYPADKSDYGVVYATFKTKDGKTFEAKVGDKWEDCQIRLK